MKIYSVVYMTARERIVVDIVKAESEEEVLPLIVERNEGTLDEGFYPLRTPKVEEIPLTEEMLIDDPEIVVWRLYHQDND